MSLYTRLLGIDDPKLPVHQFMAAVGEVERGVRTESQLATVFNLSAGEQTELSTLMGKILVPLEGYVLGGRVTLTNVGNNFDANNDSLSLPFIYLQRAGVTRIDIELRVRKVGTGTQEWCLRDDTTPADVIRTENGSATANTTGSLSDAGAAADRTLSASRTFPTPLGAGIVKLRLQCKSTVAADDPVFLGGAILLFRKSKLTAVELHEVLCLAEYGISGYATENDLKARLGV